MFLAGRTKDFIKLGGNRVSAVEIESVLDQHPGIATSAVVGATDDDGAEQAVAFVVLVPGAQLDDTELRRHCRQRMPAFKVPRFVHIVPELPLTPSNKIAKSVLKEWIANDPTLLDRRPRPRPGGDSD